MRGVRWCEVKKHHQTSRCSDIDRQEGGCELIHGFVMLDSVEYYSKDGCVHLLMWKPGVIFLFEKRDKNVEAF